MYDVITIGAATRDVFLKSVAFEVHEGDHSEESVEGCFPLGAKIELDDILFETGGGATNAAVTFARLGHRTATISAVGDDASGRDIIDALERERVATDLVQRLPEEQTAFSVIVLAGSGERTILVYRGASQKIDGDAVPWDGLTAKWLYVTSFGGNIALMDTVLAHAEKNGIAVAWNPGAKEIRAGFAALSPLIAKVDIINVNKEEAADLAGTSDLPAIMAKLRPLPRRAAIVTDGLQGAYAADKKGIVRSRTLDVPRVNTTGAGDAFGSGVVAGLLKKDDLRYALAVGTWNATGVVQRMGAKRGILRGYPTDAAIKKIAIEPYEA